MVQNTRSLLVILLFALAPASALRAEESDNSRDKTLSPYFAIQTADANVDAMPLKSTDVDVKILGSVADVRVTQVYSNAGGRPLEAIYVFPGSTRAAVYGMEMRIGERVLTAKVHRRDEARRTYEAAKSEGKSASLLEQHRPNVFQMNVANILPGDTITVDLHYTELLIPSSGEYEFVFPTVVGPRYSNQPEKGAPDTERWVQNPYLQKGVRSPAAFSLALDIVAAMPLQDLRCVSQDATPDFRDASHAVVRLAGNNALANNRDFILKYRLADAKIESGLLLSKGAAENFFLLTVQPPKRVTPADLPPREYVFVIDVSGSMNGFPLEIAKRLMTQLFDRLRPQDSFNVLLFSGGSALLSERSLPANADNIRNALAMIGNAQGRGSTELLPALDRALKLPPAGDAARSIVVVTDGYVPVETKAFDLVRNNLNRANLFAFGIGSSVNRFLIEGLARAGQGEPLIITRPEEADAQARRFGEYISSPVLTHITTEFDGFETYDIEPPTAADVLADRPLVLFGKWRGNAQGRITVRGKSGAGDYAQSFAVADARTLESTRALDYLWARSRIATLGDYDQLTHDSERAKEITNLGLTYNLLTAYTSFVAVDHAIRNPGAEAEQVKQPLPLPSGVENTAVGAPVSTTPEPETWALILVIAGALAVRIYRTRHTPCA